MHFFMGRVMEFAWVGGLGWGSLFVRWFGQLLATGCFFCLYGLACIVGIHYLIGFKIRKGVRWSGEEGEGIGTRTCT